MHTVYQNNRRIDYASLIFRGGEPHVEIVTPKLCEEEDILIDARVRNMNDLGTLLALTNAIRNAGARSISLNLPYFPGARQDRVTHGSALTVKVFADIINQQNYSKVHILDPHSDVTPALINNCVVHSSAGLIERFISETTDDENVYLICPDAGAEKRIYEIAKHVKPTKVIHASKHRNTSTGELTGFKLEPLPCWGQYIIVDDICDGGGTFNGIASLFKQDKHAATSRLNLWVTHGIFSRGLFELFENFSHIGTTDSWCQANDYNECALEVYPCFRPGTSTVRGE